MAWTISSTEQALDGENPSLVRRWAGHRLAPFAKAGRLVEAARDDDQERHGRDGGDPQRVPDAVGRRRGLHGGEHGRQLVGGFVRADPPDSVDVTDLVGHAG